MPTPKPSSELAHLPPPVGDVWASQVGTADEDGEDAEQTDREANAKLETVARPENADAFEDEPTYEKTEHDSTPQPEENFDAVEVICQLQNVAFRPRSNGLGIFVQFETGLEVLPAIAKIKGADLLFDKVLFGHGATISSISTRPDADGNLKTRINLMLPESELMRADMRPLISKVALLRLEPAQMTFDLTSRAK
jgi:hypothetical protein